jgi:D-alanine transaminase
MDIIYLNGEFKKYEEALIHIEDRGMEFADGVYEVILFNNNKLIDAKPHILRLFRSLNQLNINIDLKEQDIEKIILELFSKNNQKKGSVYLQITRGFNKRTQLIEQNLKSTIFAKISPLTTNISKLPKAISVITTEDIRWKRCDIKSLALIAGSMAKQKAVDLGYDDAIFIKDSMAMEASFANLFVIDKQNNLITRFTDNYILSGITRARIIDLAKKNNINVIEKSISYSELLNAKEVFITSSTLLIRPVNKINEKIIADGKIGEITKKLYQLYQDFIFSLNR